MARHVLRGDQSMLNAAARALGISCAPSACRAAIGASHALLWLGPDEVLALSTDCNAPVATVLADLRAYPYSLVDVSHRQVSLEVSGPDAEILLCAGCPLDLHPDQFVVDMCTRTVLAKAEVVLWRKGPQAFHLEVARSYAQYVFLFLAEAARELA